MKLRGHPNTGELGLLDTLEAIAPPCCALAFCLALMAVLKI